MKPDASPDNSIKRNSALHRQEKIPRVVTAAVAIGAFFVVAILLFRLGNPPRRVTPGLAMASVAPTDIPLPRGDVPLRPPDSLGLVVGERLKYRFEQKCRYTTLAQGFAGISPNLATNETTTLEIEQKAEFVANIFGETTDGWIVGFSFPAATVRMVTGDGTIISDDVGSKLATEVLALVHWRGAIGKIITPVPVSIDALRLWRDVLARWQTVLAGDPSSHYWTSTEEDGTGTFEAHYWRNTNSTPSGIIKAKQRYARLGNTSLGRGLAPPDIKARAAITMDPYPTKIEGHERMAFGVPEIGGIIEFTTAYKFQLEVVATIPEVAQAGPTKLRDFAAGIDVGWTSEGEGEPVVIPVDIAGTTIDDQLQELDSILKAGIDGTIGEFKVLEKIKSLIEQDAVSVDGILKLLGDHQGDRNESFDAAVVGMLGSAGTRAAQKALLDLASTEGGPVTLRERALSALAQVDSPIAEAGPILSELHSRKDELSNNALLTLGTFGNKRKGQDPEQHAWINDYVIAAADEANLDLNDLIAALAAIGNLGPDHVPAVVQTSLISHDPLVREKALLSLERIPIAEAAPFAQTALQGDGEPSVRATAAKMLGERGWAEGFPNLLKAAEQDPSGLVRIAAVEALGNWPRENPEVLRVVGNLAAHDTDPDVRDVADQILKSRSGPKVEAAQSATPPPPQP